MANDKFYKVPPRWLNCPRKGLQLVAGKFLPFKTPLDSHYDESVPLSSTFKPTMLLSSIQSYQVKLGLWIDLTNTDRFYDKSEIEALGIKYLKLQCRGHGECPSTDQTSGFIKICKNFISKNPLECIGVHCTHGFNRTGFMITAYLVEEQSWSVEAAVSTFAQIRPPGIYKADYLRELFARYGDSADTPPPPQLPDWCLEEEEEADGEDPSTGGDQDDGNSSQRRREFTKKNPTFMEGVGGVKPVSSSDKLSRIQRKCQDMCEWKSKGFPGLQPVSMDINNISFLEQKPYRVSWKADGTRYMMLIDGEKEVYFVDRDNCVFQVSNLRFPRRDLPDQHINGTLLDGEMVIDKTEDGILLPRYLVYDIVRFQTEEIGKSDFNQRLHCINKQIIEPRRFAMERGQINKSTEPFSVRAKQFWDIKTTQYLLSEKFTKQLGHEMDGLIFQPVTEPYIGGRNSYVLKWKPPNLNSIDFKLIVKREERPGMLRETKGYLMVGSYNLPFAEIKVNKTLKDYNNKIIECKLENNEWKFLRERTDKSFPNSYNTAMGVCQSIIKPVTKELLLDLAQRQPVFKRLVQSAPHSAKRLKTETQE